MTHELHRDSVFDLAGRTALITGASSGIGEHFARVLSRNGANLVLAARREDRLETLKQEIEAAGGRALAVGMDVTDEESTIAAFGRAEETFGTVDTIIANAGIGQNTATMKLSIDEIDALLSINMKGAFLTAREGMRRMRGSEAQTRGDGRVILTSSITGSARVRGLAVYGASKAGLAHLGRSLAAEWATRGVNVNVICPGYISTEINAGMFDSDYGQQTLASWPRQRVMDITALDGALLYLASNASRFTTGAVIDIDDGQYI